MRSCWLVGKGILLGSEAGARPFQHPVPLLTPTTPESRTRAHGILARDEPTKAIGCCLWAANLACTHMARDEIHPGALIGLGHGWAARRPIADLVLTPDYPHAKKRQPSCPSWAGVRREPDTHPTLLLGRIGLARAPFRYATGLHLSTSQGLSLSGRVAPWRGLPAWHPNR